MTHALLAWSILVEMLSDFASEGNFRPDCIGQWPNPTHTYIEAGPSWDTTSANPNRELVYARISCNNIGTWGNAARQTTRVN